MCAGALCNDYRARKGSFKGLLSACLSVNLATSPLQPVKSDVRNQQTHETKKQ
jgi:hypothetical protein